MDKEKEKEVKFGITSPVAGAEQIDLTQNQLEAYLRIKLQFLIGLCHLSQEILHFSKNYAALQHPS